MAVLCYIDVQLQILRDGHQVELGRRRLENRRGRVSRKECRSLWAADVKRTDAHTRIRQFVSLPGVRRGRGLSLRRSYREAREERVPIFTRCNITPMVGTPLWEQRVVSGSAGPPIPAR